MSNILPKHVAIIPDGNGRWAKSRSLDVSKGHQAGMEALEKVIDHLRDRGVRYVTIYGFSSDNWKRSEKERSGIFQLMEFFFQNRYSRLFDGSTKLKILGEISGLPKTLQNIIQESLDKTSANSQNFVLQVAINYGSRAEIVRAFNQIHQNINKGIIKEIDEQTISDNLYTKETPDPDLLIRTGDEYRISNFLLYQMSYTEFFFIDKYWPDIVNSDIDLALDEYAKRERRFGGRDEN